MDIAWVVVKRSNEILSNAAKLSNRRVTMKRHPQEPILPANAHETSVIQADQYRTVEDMMDSLPSAFSWLSKK